MIHGKSPIAFLMIELLLLFLCACHTEPELPLTQPKAETSATAVQTTTAAPTTKPATTVPTTTEPTTIAPAAFSVDDVAMTATPNSSCFSKIGYSEAFQTLVVTFRGSGKTYCYTNFTAADWAAFRSADSLGSYYNAHIKGNYPCEKA